jgi:HEAT repeat protein
MARGMEPLTAMAFAILVLVLVGTGLLIVATVVRRQQQEKYFEGLGHLRRRYEPVLRGLLTSECDPEGLAALRALPQQDLEILLDQFLSQAKLSPAQADVLRQLCAELGLLEIWQRHLQGQVEAVSLRDALSRPEGLLHISHRLRFLLRGRGARNLGALRDRASWPLLVQALDDPHPDVQAVALRSLAAIQEPQSFPALVERLHVAVLGHSSLISPRAFETALASFPLSQALGLLPSLRHPHARIRFLATDVVREMVKRQAASNGEFVLDPALFPQELTELSLTELACDPNPEVRGRAVAVIAHLDPARSTPVLRELLDDPEWFVRLRTLRAIAERRRPMELAEITRRLTDQHWAVREAAAQALLAFGPEGVDKLLEHFLNSTDSLGQEQVVEEMQRAGLIPLLLERCGNSVYGREARVIEKLLRLGFTSCLLGVLKSSPNAHLRKKFLEEFGQHPDPQIQAWVKDFTGLKAGEEAQGLAQPSTRLAA